jgi:hypothetical protein
MAYHIWLRQQQCNVVIDVQTMFSMKNGVFWDVTPFFIVTAMRTSNLTCSSMTEISFLLQATFILSQGYIIVLNPETVQRSQSTEISLMDYP